MESPTRKAFQAKPLEPVVPSRLREPLYHVVDDAMPLEVPKAIGKWLFEHRDRLERGGDDQGLSRFNYEIIDVERYCDHIAEMRKHLIKAAMKPETLRALEVPEFDLRHVETHATLYHHGSHFDWHDDIPGYDGELVPTRRITFCYYMATDPPMFSGGELEFLDGTKVEPKNNRLCFFHPVQQHRVRPVESWSAHVLHGRWAIMGWLHGDPPAGWLARIPTLRGRPRSG